LVNHLDGDIEQQQKVFNKSKQKIIQSMPVLQEPEASNSDNNENGPGYLIYKTKSKGKKGIKI
jgi:hypothetical protein